MAAASLLLLSVATRMLGLQHAEGRAETAILTHQDASFCYGGLEVMYPHVDVNRCIIIPKDLNLREKISKVWDAPKVLFPGADKRKKYVLMMVDPDAPSRSTPTAAHWRHWLVVDIEGGGLKTGELRGTTLSEYRRPTPPQTSGFHRYQFMLFEQPPDASMSLTTREKSSPGGWDPQAFIRRFDLDPPVATVQFLTQNHHD